MSADPARMAAMSWPDQNRNFSRRWMDELDQNDLVEPRAPGRRLRIRSSHDPAVLRAQTSPNLGTYPWSSWGLRR